MLSSERLGSQVFLQNGYIVTTWRWQNLRPPVTNQMIEMLEMVPWPHPELTSHLTMLHIWRMWVVCLDGGGRWSMSCMSCGLSVSLRWLLWVANMSSKVCRVKWCEVAAKKGTEVYRRTVSIWFQWLKWYGLNNWLSDFRGVFKSSLCKLLGTAWTNIWDETHTLDRCW